MMFMVGSLLCFNLEEQLALMSNVLLFKFTLVLSLINKVNNPLGDVLYSAAALHVVWIPEKKLGLEIFITVYHNKCLKVHLPLFCDIFFFFEPVCSIFYCLFDLSQFISSQQRWILSPSYCIKGRIDSELM